MASMDIKSIENSARIETPKKVKRVKLSLIEENSEHSENMTQREGPFMNTLLYTKRKNMQKYVLPMPKTMMGKLQADIYKTI